MQRLKKPSDFQRVRHEGKTWAHPLLVVGACANGLPFNRYGIVVSKKVGNAVARNRARRLIRVALTHLHPRLRPGHDVVVIARAAINQQMLAAVANALQNQFRRANLLFKPVEASQ